MVNKEMTNKCMTFLDSTDFYKTIDLFKTVDQNSHGELVTFNRTIILKKIDAIVAIFIRDNIAELKPRRGIESLLIKINEILKPAQIILSLDRTSWASYFRYFELYIRTFNDYNAKPYLLIETEIESKNNEDWQKLDWQKIANSPVILGTKEGLTKANEINVKYAIMAEDLEKERKKQLSQYIESKILEDR